MNRGYILSQSILTLVCLSQFALQSLTPLAYGNLAQNEHAGKPLYDLRYHKMSNDIDRTVFCGGCLCLKECTQYRYSARNGRYMS